ncbi:MAG: tRNA (adenosine(37)-N6)-threonylcarbamoyltransferase complex ATPase subunit type 1 TsaE [Planctomycetota bacterium]
MSLESTAQPSVPDWSCETHSVDATRQLGATLGQALEPSSVVALSGNLGAGKTHLTQGIAEGLGIERRLVNSPTFALVQEYAGRLPVFHFDTYRLRNVDEFLDLGFDEYLSLRGVCIIEWAERVANVLPADTLTVRVTATGETTRSFEWHAGGTISQRVLTKLRDQFSSNE